MPGGLLNLVSYGNQNIILNGNPSKTFFKCVYSRYTNFGLQKFRVDFEGIRNLRLTESSIFRFKIPRHADLLMDTYLVINLPTIWSPVLPPTNDTLGDIESIWRPYEFKWIKDIGSQIIERIRFTVGGATIQELTGQYLKNLVERDFYGDKKLLYYDMTGNIDELNNPAYAFNRNGYYPNVYPTNIDNYDVLGPEPSIRGRQLFIPINVWFTLQSKLAFPLVSLQYQELNIEVELKSIEQLFTVRDIEKLIPPTTDNTELSTSGYKVGSHIKPNFNKDEYQFYKFLQPPPWKMNENGMSLNNEDWEDKRTIWSADIHLLCTYAFLSDEEIKYFTGREQKYLIKQIYHNTFENIVGTSKVNLKSSSGMVSNFMWFLQRNDVNLRNEWSNYTNWPYNELPHGLIHPDGIILDNNNNIINQNAKSVEIEGKNYIPSVNPDNSLTNIKITGNFSPENVKNIMNKWGFILDGKYRENTLDSGVLSYVEKYARNQGYSSEDLYCYNFSLSSNPFEVQPFGAMNLSKFKKIEFEITTNVPSMNSDPSQANFIFNENGDCIGTNYNQYNIYNYTYNLNIIEERYNIISFINGNASLIYTR